MRRKKLSDVKFPIRLVLTPNVAPGIHIDITDIVDPETDLGRLARWAEGNKATLSLRTKKD